MSSPQIASPEPTDEELRSHLEAARNRVISARGTLDLPPRIEPELEGVELHGPCTPVEMDDYTREWWQQIRAENAQRARQNIGLPDEYLTGRFGFHSWIARTPAERDALSRAEAWATGTAEKCSLLLTGSVGVRKSGLAMSALAAVADRHPRQRIRYITFVAMANVIRAVFSADDEESEASAVARFAETPFLAIDDLDKGNVSPWVVKTLWNVVNERERHHRATIFTANAIGADDPLENLVHRFSLPGMATDAEAIVDRIRGMSVHVHLVGRSER